MSQLIEVKVPDIGDFKDIPVIEISVKPGDTVKAEDSLVTLESDKATMDVPTPVGGIVRAVLVAVGDKVSEGSAVVLLASTDEEKPAPGAAVRGEPMEPPPASTPDGALSFDTLRTNGEAGKGAPTPHHDCDLLVLGGGPGGYSAAFRAADLGMKVIIVERYGQLGGVCLNVGCIPSKALLHVAAVMDEAAHLGVAGISFAAPAVDIDALRAHKAKVVGKLTTGLAGMARARKVDVVRGFGSFVDPHHIEVEFTTGDGQDKSGEKRTIGFRQAIIAAGSQAVHLPLLQNSLPDDPRIVDSTGALELRSRPQRLLVIGGGIIGLEMATVYSTLGARVDVVEMLDSLMQGPDRDLVKVWEKQNAQRFDKVMLKTRTVAVEAKPDGLHVSFEGENAPAEPQRYDMILQAAGRAPNGHKIGAEKAGIVVNERGFVPVDGQMRTNVPHIFAIGDIVGQPMLAHKAVHEGHVAAEAAAGRKSFFDATVIPGVAYTHPEVAWVGLGEDEAKKAGRTVECAKFPWAASGRAIANGAEYGFTKLVFDGETHRIVGGSIVGPGAGDMIGEIALAIEMGADAVDIGRTIHPHPTLGESIGLAAEVAHGSCTDLPPPRRKS